MNAAPEVSIVIPTRDRWQLLAAHGLRSALAQEDVDFEVIVVDDGSVHGPGDMVGLDERRVRAVRHERPRKLAAARNTGIAAARGTWLAFLDDDDLWAPWKLRRQLDTAAASGAEWAYTGAVAIDSRRDVVDVEPAPDPREVESLLFTGNHVPGGGSGVIARASLVARIGGFDEELVFLTDWDYWLRLASAALPAACPEPLVARLVHPGNLLFRETEPVLPSFERMLAKHRTVTARDRQTIAEWVAQRYFDAGRRREAARRYLHVALAYRSLGNLPPALGALFGERGMTVASRLLSALGGTTHLDVGKQRAATPTPTWLERYA